MTSVFSSLVMPVRKGSASSAASPANIRDAYNHVHDLAMSDDASGEEPSIRELNNALRVLVDLFPDVQPDVFREMLTRVSPASRLEIVAEQLLKRDAEYIQGRYRRGRGGGLKSRSKTTDGHPKNAHPNPSASTQQQQLERPALTREETFRTKAYAQTVKQALYDEFKSLSHSAIKAVLAETNHHYTPARAALLDIASKSWTASIANFFFRRKTPLKDDHPFIAWTASKHSAQKLPRLQPTGNAELDHELHHGLIVPALEREKEAQCIVDSALAHQIADGDAQDAKEEYDCDVCYSTVSIYKVGLCDDGGHYICFRCIEHTITEAVYGQGWARSISRARGTMKCVAPILDGSGDCKGCIPFSLVQLALRDKEVRGESTLQKFEQRLASTTLQDTGLPLVHCPFCSYAEVDDLMLRQSLTWKVRDPRELKIMGFWMILLLVSAGGLLLLLPLFSLLYLFQRFPPLGVYNPFRPALVRLARKSRGLRFTCRSPTCGKRSCLRCDSPWLDPHACYATQLHTLQRSIEAAQTAAVKRVCPRCNLSFVKSSGCNKLVCPCGYSMCYLCRAEIVKSGSPTGGYDHFCQHFRVVAGGRCTQCDKCDLYREEDEREILKAARDRAEAEWRDGEGSGVSVKKEDVEMLVLPPKLGWARVLDAKSWQVWLDTAVERFVVVEVD